ncbi:MAG: ABC transporter ATP-binding protein [Fretibacterium sp.]|nr:ABC transporter ATP-binding protein [Fretibacterium sp.]
MPAAIKIENLGKRYLLTHRQSHTLREALACRGERAVHRLLHPFERRASLSPATPAKEEFWALRNLSFSVQEGERVGIIGHNGAGKSTLLKLLSRITEPTEGRISLKGRVSSLLEVGTGFHPELTGRENIYLNAAILGMTRAEIRRNFDAIVDFAGVEKFLDTPVKRYSSGMYIRLAFAIAAHLNSEILIIDEVLAVGDMEFQKKCMGKMDEVSHKEGRTILFVSHNMGAVSQLCSRVIYLEKGHVLLDTCNVSEGIRQYIDTSRGEKSVTEWRNPGGLFENPWFKPLRFGLYDEEGKRISGTVERRDKVWLEIEGITETPDSTLGVGYALYAENGALLYQTYQTDQTGSSDELPRLNRRTCLRAPVPTNILNLGEQRLELLVQLHGRQWIVSSGSTTPSVFLRVDGAVNASPYSLAKRPGPVVLDIPWSLKDVPEGGER